MWPYSVKEIEEIEKAQVFSNVFKNFASLNINSDEVMSMSLRI